MTSIWFIPMKRRTAMAKKDRSQRTSTSYTRRSRKQVPDVKMAAANDTVVEAPVVEAPALVQSAPTPERTPFQKAVLTGHQYHKIAGSPTKQGVIRVFGQRGYALSWIQRAARLNTEPDALALRFKNEPDAVKADWEEMLRQAQ